MLELAQVRNLEGRHEEAAALFDEAARALSETVGASHSRTLLAQSLLAAMYVVLRRLDEAEPLLNHVLENVESLPRSERGIAVYYLGNVRAQRGDRVGAIAKLREAFEVYGFTYQFDSDWSLASLFDDPEFIDLAKRVRAKDPHLWESRQLEATRLAGERRYDEAEDLLVALIRDAPSEGHTESAAWNLATVVYLPQGRYAEAERFMEMSIDVERRRGPMSWVSLHGLAIARFGKGDRAGAKAAIDEAIHMVEAGPDSPPSPVPFLFRSYRSAMDGEEEEALRHLTKAYERGLTGVPLVESKLLLRRLHGNPEFERLRRRMAERAEYP